jgi:hypothetical protein
LNANGSSLPNCSGRPVVRSLSVRAFDRWIASAIMSRVASPRDRRVVGQVDVIADTEAGDWVSAAVEPGAGVSAGLEAGALLSAEPGLDVPI